jgi:hypothetical protein
MPICAVFAVETAAGAVVRSTLGPAVADQLLGEHSSMKTMLATLDTMAATDPNFDMQLRGSLDAMILHMQVRLIIYCICDVKYGCHDVRHLLVPRPGID